MSVKYRVCFNSAPHLDDWWTVEKSRRGLFGDKAWKTAQKIGRYGGRDMAFESEAEAQAWIDEDKLLPLHIVGPEQ